MKGESHLAEYAKKTPLGYKVFPDDSSAREATHVILTKEEHEQLLREERNLERKLQSQRNELTAQLQKAEDDAFRRVRAAEATAKQCAQEMEKKLARAQQISDYWEQLNEDLLRMSRERANADRNLRPKKQHTGYVVLASAEKERRYEVPNEQKMKRATLWETVIQTPYSVDFTEEQVRQQTGTEETLLLLQRIGITADHSVDCEKKGMHEVLKGHGKTDNVILSRFLRANFRAGYWELTILHTKPLGLVPKEMRPR